MNVTPSSTVAPIVAPRISKVITPSAPSTPNTPTAPAANVTDAASEDMAPRNPIEDQKPRTAPPAGTNRPKPVAPPKDPTDRSEISKVDETSQNTIKQFTENINEKISVRLLLL